MITHVNRNSARAALRLFAVCCVLASTGCREKTEAAPDASHEEAAVVNGKRVHVPQAVRRNLGITFVTVERRPVRHTRRIPGSFELRPEARREYHVMLPGRIELLVRQYEQVTKGTPLFHLDSPAWQNMQSDLVTAINAMSKSHADVAVADARLAEGRKSVDFLRQRIAKLAAASVRQVELEAELVEKENTLPRLEAEVSAAKAEFNAAHARYDVLLGTAASLSGIARDQLDAQVDEHTHLMGVDPPWRSINRLTVHAKADGVVDRLPVTNDGWAETGDLVLDTVDPQAVRFHGDALQTNISFFRNGQKARIVPPQGGSTHLQDVMEGTIEVAFEAHPKDRTISIYLIPTTLASWAKSGVTAYLEVFTSEKDAPVLAIPETCIVRDGLEVVFFRRDPNDPDVVIRTDADLGESDGRWVEVRSGVMPGDQIVQDGVYPIMLSSSTSSERQEGGHFHADGTFHAGDDH